MPAENLQRKRTLSEQILLLPISLFAGYIFASLRISNEVKYFPLSQVSGETFILAAVIAILIYAAATAVLRTKARAFVGGVFRVFDTDKNFDLIYLICALFFFFSIFMITLKETEFSDYIIHTDNALSFDWSSLKKSFINTPYPLWHISVNLLSKVFYIPRRIAAALASAGFYTVEYCVIRKLAITYNKELTASKIKLIDLFLLSLMYLQPIYVPIFNPNQYSGQGTPNVWHNPTIISSYAIALICVYLFVKMLETLKNKEKIAVADFIRSGLFLLLSVSAKPSFIQIFAPAVAVVFVIMLIKTKGDAIGFELKYLLSCIPAGMYCIAVFVLSFKTCDGSGGSGVAAGFFNVWRVYTMSIPISILLGFGFPIAYISVQRRNIQNKLPYCFSLICLLFGFLEYGFLYETGRRMYDGNFGWGFLTGMTLIFCFTAIDWIQPLLQKKRLMIIPLIVYILHLICGFRYYIEIFRGSFYY